MGPDFRSVRYFAGLGEWISIFITTLPHKSHSQLKPSHWISGPQEVRVPFVVGPSVCCYQDNLLLLNSVEWVGWNCGLFLTGLCTAFLFTVLFRYLLSFLLTLNLSSDYSFSFFILTLLIHGCKLKILIHHLSSKQYDFWNLLLFWCEWVVSYAWRCTTCVPDPLELESHMVLGKELRASEKVVRATSRNTEWPAG